MNGATCKFCGKGFSNRQAVRAHLKGCPAYRHVPQAAVPTRGSEPRAFGARHTYPGTRSAPDSPTLAWSGDSSLAGRIQAERARLELHRLEEANRELEAKAQRREQAELDGMFAEANRVEGERTEREAAKRRALADVVAQAQQERRQREAQDGRLRAGKQLAETAVETVPGLNPWDRFVIQRAVAAALEKANDTEPIEKIVDSTISLQLRMLTRPKPAEPVRPQAAPVNPPVEVEEPDDVDEEPDDEEEPCEDQDCEHCNPSSVQGSGWGLVLLLGGIVVLAVGKHLADNRTAVPPTKTPTS